MTIAPSPRSVLFALPGLHAVARGAEVAFEAVARGLAINHGWDVVLAGSGDARQGTPYRFFKVPSTPRERFEKWPKFPPFRSEFRWEEATFAWNLRKVLALTTADISVTCSYPFVNWALRRVRSAGGSAAPHVFVTQNGDHPALRKNSEYRLFRCDGLVCTNPEFFERNRSTWHSALIPNGVDTARFRPGPPDRAAFGLPDDVPLIVMASALIPSKQVPLAIKAVAQVPGAFLAIAGDGPERESVDSLARELLPGRHLRTTLQPEQMPEFYRCGDVFLHLSREESFGNVYIEAMACGIPVVAHDYPTTRWILGDHAALVDTSDPAKTAAAIRSSLDSPPCAPSALHDEAARRFSWDGIAAQYSDFFTGLLPSKSPSRNAA